MLLLQLYRVLFGSLLGVPRVLFWVLLESSLGPPRVLFWVLLGDLTRRSVSLLMTLTMDQVYGATTWRSLGLQTRVRVNVQLRATRSLVGRCVRFRV